MSYPLSHIDFLSPLVAVDVGLAVHGPHELHRFIQAVYDRDLDVTGPLNGLTRSTGHSATSINSKRGRSKSSWKLLGLRAKDA